MIPQQPSRTWRIERVYEPAPDFNKRLSTALRSLLATRESESLAHEATTSEDGQSQPEMKQG